MKPIMMAATAVLALGACAPGYDSIAPVTAPAGSYDGLSCSEARAESLAITQRLSALAAQQNSAVTGDAVGVFLIGVPMSSLTGGDKQGVIAAEKGKQQAIEARIARAC